MAVAVSKKHMCILGGKPGDFRQYLVISKNCNINANSFCNLGGTYSPPDGYKYESAFAQNYLAGRHKFKVLEIEVYEV